MLDPIADMLTRIRNAQRAGHSEVVFPSSKFKKSIAEVLLKKGFIKSLKKVPGKRFDMIKISLKYYKKNDNKKVIPAIKQIRRISKEGQRIYVGSDDIRKVKNGYGIMIISTSKGVMSGEDARKENVGGELVCEVW